MHSLLLLVAPVICLVASMTSEANAIVCARGVYRAGCAGYRGAVVVRRPYVAGCRWIWVNGVRVRRCY